MLRQDVPQVVTHIGKRAMAFAGIPRGVVSGYSGGPIGVQRGYQAFFGVHENTFSNRALHENFVAVARF